MIRNLKVLLAAGMALAALSAFGVPGAQAAEFHCSVSPCKLTLKPDGAVPGKTSHIVFSYTIGGTTTSITCNHLTGSGTSSTKTSSAITITGLVYHGCTVGGQSMSVDMNGCDYEFTSDAAGTMHIKCPGAIKQIELTFGTCTIDIPEQTVTGIEYHNIGAGATTQVTVSTGGVKNLVGTATAGCFSVGNFTNGELTTGNTIVTAETDPGGVMAEGWYA